MTGTDIATVDVYARSSLEERRNYAATIAQAGALLSQSVRAQGAPGVFLMAETGAMLGIHPIAALQGIHVIDGKPTLSANLLAALTRRAGHRLRVSTTGDWNAGTFRARAELTRADDPEHTFVVEWSKDRAQAAGLLGKRGPWQSYPEAMCKSRAITEVIREGASDVTLVPAYTPEELGANVTEEGEVILTQPSAPPAAPQETQEATIQATVEPEQQQPQQSAPEAPQQSDVVDAEIAMSEDWVDQATKASSAEDVLAIYRAARLKGELVAKVDIDGEEVELGQWLIGIGKALKEAEITDQGAPAVLDGAEPEQHTTGGHY